MTATQKNALVTKAFRLLWHFCQYDISRLLSIRYKSQKPFGHKSLSASLAFLPLRSTAEKPQLQRDWSQKPFGHKSLSASLAFLPEKWSRAYYQKYGESQKPFGFFGISARRKGVLMESIWKLMVTKAFRLLWHFCLPGYRVKAGDSVYPSQKPFGFFGISAAGIEWILHHACSKSQKPFGFFGISA